MTRLNFRAIAAATVLVIASGPAWPAAGDLDTSFSGDGKLLMDFGGREAINAVARQSDGRIIAVGSLNGDFLVIRFTSAGALDTTFDGDGFRLINFGAGDGANAIVIQNDGRIVVAGAGSDFAVARLTSGGALDATFGHGGLVIGDYGETGAATANAIAVDALGRIVLAGASGAGNFGVARLNPDGTFDLTFSGDGRLVKNFGGTDTASGLALRSDGAVVVAGTADGGSASGTRANLAVAVFNGIGNDTAFGAGEPNSPVTDVVGCADSARTVLVQPDNRILVGGGAGINCLSGSPDSSAALVRYNTNGTLDTTFSGDGIAVFGFGTGDGDTVVSMALQADGAIVAAGTTNLSSATTPHLAHFGIARLRGTDGAVDLTFHGDGSQQTSFGTGEAAVTAILLQPTDGRIVAAGAFTTFDANGALQTTDVAMARHHAITCNNLNATRIGTSGADTLVGITIASRTGTLHVADVIHGMGGADTIDGLGANDSLCGGDGNDTLRGGDGNDFLFGQAGGDTMEGGAGTDTCFTIANEIETIAGCETVNTGRSGLSGAWQQLEQHCSGSASQPACQLVGVVTAINPGDESTAVSTTVTYFLSDDVDLTNDDRYLGEDTVPALPAGSTRDLQFVHRLTGESDLLGHYVLAFFDATDVVAERNEQNNVAPGVISGR
jgi:uncharacterized delta-60 repeat protein